MVFSLVAVAFYTLMERRVLGNFHIRIGPFMVGFMGYFQPFRDAIKLFVKRNLNLRFNLTFIWAFSSCFSLFLYICLLIVFPLGGGYMYLTRIFLLFICLMRTRIYFLMFGGYFSGRKYSLMGRYRSVIQMVSYEIVLIFLFVVLFYFYSSWNFSEVFYLFNGVTYLFCIPFIFIWIFTILSESNRLPYDFLEGESELVSGFNTEYWGGYFSFLFIYEYGCIILFRILTSFLLFSGFYSVVFFIFIIFMFLWVRATYPRFRFDFMMGFIWKNLLGISMLVSLYFFVI